MAGPTFVEGDDGKLTVVIKGLEDLADNADILAEQRAMMEHMSTEEIDALVQTLEDRGPTKFGREIVGAIRSLSYSSITGYMKCPYQWYMQRVKKIQKPSSEPQVFGGACHKVWTDFQVLVARGQSGIDVQGLWHTEFGKEIDERDRKWGGVDWGKSSQEECYQEGKFLWDTANMKCDFIVSGDWENKQEFQFEHIEGLMQMFPVIMTKGKYDFTPETEAGKGYPSVERFVDMVIPGVQKKILGFIDWMDGSGVPHDLKTSGRSWYKGSVESELQPNLYLALLLAKAPEILHPSLTFKHVVLVRNKKPKAMVVSSVRTPEQIMWSLAIVKRVWEQMALGVITPNPEFQWCGSRCDFWDMCLGEGGKYREDELGTLLNLERRSERKEELNVGIEPDSGGTVTE